jgi:8-oxo-dGTP pyrophosphatase MutT (NUDIX family)
MKKFNNIHNKCYKVDGKEIWESRSCAVVGIVILLKDFEFYVLINKRGIGAAPPQGKFNLCCGYIDFFENSIQALTREIYEECGISIDEILQNNKILIQYLNQPFFVNTDPKENRQNISLTYALVFASDEFPKTTNEYSEPNEIEDIQWVNIKDIDKYDFAFNHNEIIKIFYKKHNLKLFLYKILNYFI